MRALRVSADPETGFKQTRETNRRRRFNVGRVNVLNDPPNLVEVRVNFAGRVGKAHQDQQHDGDVQARVLDHRVQRAAEKQGLTIVHFSAHCKHILWDTLGA